MASNGAEIPAEPPAGAAVALPQEDGVLQNSSTKSLRRARSFVARCITSDESEGRTPPTPGLQSKDEEPQKWMLGRRAAVPLGAFVALCLLFVGLFPPLLQPWEGCDDAQSEREVKGYLIAAAAMALPSGLACAFYLRVAIAGPRSWHLHAHGVILFVVLVQSSLGEYGNGTSIFGCDTVTSGVIVAVSGFLNSYKTPLIMLMVRKFDALVPCDRVPHRCCGGCLRHTRRWGYVAAANFLVLHLCYISAGLLMAAFAARGATAEELTEALQLEFPEGEGSSGAITPALKVGFAVTMRVATFSIASMLFTLPAFCLAVFNRTRATLNRLKERKVRQSSFRRNWWTLHKHFLGALLTMITSFFPPMVPVLGAVAKMKIGHESEYAVVWSMAPRLLDTLGDVLGILLLSDIWAMLQRDHEGGAFAGDVGSRIKDGLQAAVLTSRADIVFEGSVSETIGQQCIVSFPGKCVPEWNALTWLCGRGEVSSACVFLPREDPKGRFGRHVENPEKVPGQECWCLSLYGEKKDWGCAWFHEWRQNVEKAVQLGHELIVVYFPGEIGRGKVAWDDLSTADLWLGDGLGGSQKGEVAYLMRQGYSFVEEDIASLNHLFTSRAPVTACATPAAPGTRQHWRLPWSFLGART